MTERRKEGCGRPIGITDLDAECALSYGVQESRGRDGGSDAVVKPESEETRRCEDQTGVARVWGVEFG